MKIQACLTYTHSSPESLKYKELALLCFPILTALHGLGYFRDQQSRLISELGQEHYSNQEAAEPCKSSLRSLTHLQGKPPWQESS